MSLLAFLAAMFFAGHQAAEWAWRRSARAPLLPLERLCASALLGFILWLAITWALALGHQLHALALQACALVAVLAGLALRAARRGAAPALASAGERTHWSYALFLLPLVVWVGYLLWRGYLLPPHTPDALTYHLPRAAMIAGSGNFQFFGLPDLRTDRLPANYELLLADFLVLAGDDTFTEWLSTLLFVLFLLEAGALAARWWGSGAHVHASVLLVASTPVLLLQGAAHKNDLMAGYLLLAGLRWLGRFWSERELFGAVLAILAACAAAGTKQQGLLLAALAAPILLSVAVRALREHEWRMGHRSIAAGAALAGFLLLGGCYYLYAALDSLRSAKAPGLSSTVIPVAYGEWAYLWQVPVLALLAPFSASDREVQVPWSGESWLWERYDLHASNFGALASLLALLLPLALWLYRREPDRLRARERSLAGLLALLIAAAILPTHFMPHGYVLAFPRYLLFLPAILVGFTACATLARLGRATGKLARGAVMAAVAASALLFACTASEIADHDKYAPPVNLYFAEERPGTRWIPSMPKRAASVLDCLAGPRDSVDFHAGFDSWIYPAFGTGRHRDVRFVRNAAQIRPDAQWVIVDRAYSVIWGHPDFKSISEWRRYLGKGLARPADLEVLEALRKDPSYRLEYLDAREVQAVFRRVSAPDAAAPDNRCPFRLAAPGD